LFYDAPKSEWVLKDYRQDEGNTQPSFDAGNYSNSSASMPLLRSKVKRYRATHPSYSIRCFGWNVTTGYILEPNGTLTRSRVSVPSDYSWKSNFHQILSVKNRESRLWRLPEGQRARTY